MDNYSIIKKEDGIYIKSEIVILEISKTVSIFITNSIIHNFDVNQINSILNDFFEIFDDKKMGLLYMNEIVEMTNFSNMVLDYKNGIISLLVEFQKQKVGIDFDEHNSFKRKGFYFVEEHSEPLLEGIMENTIRKLTDEEKK